MKAVGESEFKEKKLIKDSLSFGLRVETSRGGNV